jgi:hypothetical protein
MDTTARWDENVLMVRWYGSSTEDEAAYLFIKNGTYRLELDGYEETFFKTYPTKPTAEEALMSVLKWQSGY